MAVSRALSMLKWSLEQRGVLGTLRVAAEKVTRRQVADPVPAFDRQNGVDTAGYIGGGRLATGSKDDVHNASYYGIAPSRLAGGLELWKEMLEEGARPEDYSFIDLGCGKGRAVMIASDQSFRRVVGVELNPALKKIAEQNMVRWRSRKSVTTEVTLVLGSVTDYQFPEGRCLIYMYNPFAAPVMEQLIRNMEEQFTNRQEELDVIYFNPVTGHLFEEHPRFTKLWSGVLPISKEDRATDLVSQDDETCSLYRYKAG